MSENKEPSKDEEKPESKDLGEDLYDADPNCKHKVVPNGYSGVMCTKCNGWFCY